LAPVEWTAVARTVERAHRADRTGLYFALTVVALIATVYLIFQLLGFVFKLLFFAAVVLVAVAAVRAWRATS
jgi:uncharacterized membrane protein YhaH (DUF805 family)